ncbi:MAG: hypothetical protein DCF16_10670 [Alphaproteobacteria bacterium]|nr:MAG: hypothetical protein DCF16_10670 [Alphaproteobacteria bacterium]
MTPRAFVVGVAGAIAAFLGWAYSSVAGPYKSVPLALGVLLLMAGFAWGAVYVATIPQDKPSGQYSRFYLVCVALSAVFFTVVAMVRYAAT